MLATEWLQRSRLRLDTQAVRTSPERFAFGRVIALTSFHEQTGAAIAEQNPS